MSEIVKAQVNNASLQAIATAIRSKNNSTDTYTPSEMAGAINALDVGGITPTGTKQITTNGTHDVTSFASANVQVPNPSTGSITITENGTYNVTNLASAIVNIASTSSIVVSVYENTSADGNKAVTLISGNSFIASNYNNSKAFALVVKISSLQVNGQYIFFNSNQQFGTISTSDTRGVYGIWANNANTVAMAPSRTVASLSTVATAVGHMYATSSGDLIIRAGGGASAFQTGNYFVMFGLMES